MQNFATSPSNRIELSPFLYMYDNYDKFIRDSSEQNQTFLITKDSRLDFEKQYGKDWVRFVENRGVWFPEKGDRVRLEYQKPNRSIMTEFGPIEVTSKIVLFENNEKYIELAQSSIIECIHPYIEMEK